MYSFILDNGKKIYSMPLNKRQYKEILKKGVLKEHVLNFGKVIELNDHSVVRLDDETDSISYFKSYNDFDLLVKQSSNLTNSLEFLFKRNPYKQLFPSHAKQLSLELLSVLEVTGNFDNNLLQKIDKKINSLSEPEFFRDDFLHQIAIVGEIVNEKFGLVWKMILAEDKETFNPCLELPNAGLIYLYEDIFRNICVDEFEFALYETYKQIEIDIDTL